MPKSKDLIIREYIDKKGEEFFDYLRLYALERASFRLLMELSDSVSVYIFSGIIRDFFLKRYEKPRDFDFVIQNYIRPNENISKFLRDPEVNYKRNSFKGIKIKDKNGLIIDAWILHDTWGIKNKGIKNPTPESLLQTVFFNFSAIAYDLRNRKFIYDNTFVDFLKTRIIDIVYEENPNIPLCLFNFFHYALKFGYKLSSRIINWIRKNYREDIDFDKVQKSHMGKIIYNSEDIHKFLKQRAMPTYGIDWNKYLSAGRIKQASMPYDASGLDKRTPFESDFGRVVFSSATRRMHDKAQVIPLTSGDVVHTRLTHSIEVMNTAQSLAGNLCRDKDFIDEYGEKGAALLERDISAILKTAAFVHDIGNPPFGHFGETVIQNYFKELLNNHILCDKFKPDYEEFDGNAQGFRILTKLLYVGHLSGLNLTYATLATYLKYPNSGRKDKGHIGTKKHGVFVTEDDILQKVADACNLRRPDGSIKRHPLSFLVEAADSICYNVMDIEDGYTQHWYEKEDIIKYLNSEITELIKKKGGNFPNFFDIEKKSYSFLKIVTNDPHFIDKTHERWNHSKWIVDFRVKVMQYLVELANSNFKKNCKDIDSGKYSKELIEDDPFCVADALQNFTRKYIFPRRIIQKAELTGHSVIRGLLDILIQYVSSSDEQFRKRVKSILSKNCMRVCIHESMEEPKKSQQQIIGEDELFDFEVASVSENAKLRLVVDFVSGMTDKFAVQLYQELSGLRI